MEVRDLSTRTQRVALLVLLISFVSFSLIVLLRSDFSTIDANVNSWAVSVHSTQFTQFAIAIDIGFDTIPMMALTGLMASYLLYTKRRGYALLIVGAMLGDVASIFLFRTLVQSPRPSDSLIIVQGYSFPSGHVTGSVVLFGLLAHLSWGHWRSFFPKVLSGSTYAAIVFIVGLDRIYLNVHWFSDVLGGYLLGTIIVTFSILTFSRLTPRSWLSARESAGDRS